MKKLLNVPIAFVIILLSVWMTPANSVAFCALRDPVKKIYKLFPKANSYRSITHKIDKNIQQQVKQQLPFTLQQDELGQHTVYIALNKKTPIGLIHARSEVGLWGLVEIVWAFDFQMNIVDFMFQRCRESSCQLMLHSDFRGFLKHKSRSQLLALLDSPSSAFPRYITHNKEALTLAKTVIRSAIKTMEITKLSWPDELKYYLKKSTL